MSWHLTISHTTMISHLKYTTLGSNFDLPAQHAATDVALYTCLYIAATVAALVVTVVLRLFL